MRTCESIGPSEAVRARTECPVKNANQSNPRRLAPIALRRILGGRAWVRRLSGALVLLGGASVVSTLAQQRPTFRSNVELVQVDVVVVNQEGDPVRGLEQAAFTVFDRGQRQTIATFKESSRMTAVPYTSAAVNRVYRDVADNQAPQASRLIVLVVDDLHIWRGRTDRAKQIAHDVIDRLAPRSSMAVLFTSGEHNVQVTADAGLLSAAVETLKGRQPTPRPHQAVDNQRRSPGSTLQDFSENMAEYETLENAAKVIGRGDGRREALVLVSEGVGKDLSDILGTMTPEGDMPQRTDARDGANLGALMGSRGIAEPYHAEAIIRMMEAMRRSNVATYVIDPRGLVKPGDLARECFPSAGGLDSDPCSSGMTEWNSPVRLAQQGLVKMSQASGGFAITNTDDFTGGLTRIVGDLDHYYLLGFYPSDPKGKGYRRLDVKVAGHPDWIVRFRRGYQADDEAKPAKKVDPLAKLSAGFMPVTDLPLRVAAIALPGGTKGAVVEYSLEVSAPASDLRETDGKLHDTLRYQLLAIDEKKSKVASVNGVEARLRLAPTSTSGAPPPIISYQVDGGVELSAGRYQLRISATSEKLSKGGSVYLDVDVPKFSDPVALGGLALGYASRPRLPVAETTTGPLAHGVAGGGRAVTSRTPGVPFAPTIDRVFSRSDMLRVYVPGSIRDQHAETALTLGVVRADGHTVITQQVPFAKDHAESTLTLQTLEAGTYVMRASLSDGANTVTRETGFTVR